MLVQGDKNIGRELLDWQGPANVAVYAVGSAWYLGEPVDIRILHNAFRRLCEVLAKLDSFLDCVIQEKWRHEIDKNHIENLCNYLQERLEV